jgi:hypothetical protein
MDQGRAELAAARGPIVRPTPRRAASCRRGRSGYGSPVIVRAGVISTVLAAVLAGPALASSAHLHMESDKGEYVGDGGKYDLRDPGTTAYVHGDRRGIRVVMEDWQLQFFVPVGDKLTRGMYRNARRYPFNKRHPGLSVFGHGRGCNKSTGSFDVRSLRFAPHDKVRSFRVRFVQRCDGQSPALRGSFTYHG